ncbi:MAG: hypothetical protein OEX81_00645 [Candidatus Pacebacteria bacterium]|nr:hypothetical protein [Candidatus Paceibacterota bacterium]
MAKELKQRSFIELLRDFVSDKGFNLFISTFSRTSQDTTQILKSKEDILKYSEKIELISLDELRDLILSDVENNSGSSDLGYFGMIINEAIEGFELAQSLLGKDESRGVKDLITKALINYYNFSNELTTLFEQDVLEERQLLIEEFKLKVAKTRDNSNLEILTSHLVKIAKDTK